MAQGLPTLYHKCQNCQHMVAKMPRLICKPLDVVNLSRFVKDLAIKEGVTEKQLAESLGMKYSDFRNGKDAKAEKQNQSLIERLKARYPSLPRDWPAGTGAIMVAPIPMVSVPVIGSAAAGLGSDNSEDYEGIQVLVPQTMLVPGARAWIVEGDSMMDWLAPGEVVIVAPRKQPKEGYAHLLQTEAHETMVKIVAYNGEEFVLRSLNKKYQDRQHTATLIGLVVGIFHQDGSYQRLEFDPSGLRPRVF